jgi:hypothetical protein
MALIFQPWLSYTVIMTIWMRNQFQPCNANSPFLSLKGSTMKAYIVWMNTEYELAEEGVVSENGK